MQITYHDQSPSFLIPSDWVKDGAFKACDVNEHNSPWNEGVDQGTPYQLIAKYEQHYGILARIGRVVLGLIVSLTILSLVFESGRKLAGDLLFNSVENIHIIRKARDVPEAKVADIHVSMAGNPAHMGHMHMIALAVTRLVEEGYRVNQVKVSLSTEDYLLNKVGEFNLL